MKSRRHPFAYLYERFPSFTQTFCYRECLEMLAQEMNPAVYSIRKPLDEPHQDFDPEFTRKVVYLPEDASLVAEIKQLHSEKKIPRAMRHKLMDWPGKTDKHRVYAAAWLGPRLKKSGIRHVHVHFAGIAARTAYWLKQFYGIGYSFTGHANDIFSRSDEGLPVSLEDLVHEASLVATVSEFSADTLRERFPDEASKIHCAYNGIELDAWRGERNRSQTFGIVATGRYIEKKGLGDLIDACGKLDSSGIPFTCKIIGEGPLHDELQKKILRQGLSEKVHLVGPKTQSEVLDILLRSSVFVLPCIKTANGDMDNLPTVIMEAMAVGLPCISTHVAGVPEMIDDGKTGRLVAQHAPEEIAEALETYARNPELASRHGDAGRVRARELFALETTTRYLKHLLVRHGSIRPPFKALRHDKKLLGAWLRF